MSEQLVSSIAVDTPSRSYDVLVGRGLLAGLGERVREVCKGDRAHIVCDDNVKPLYGKAVRRSLADAGFATSGSVFSAGEQSKTIEVWKSALEAMAEAELDRDDVVVALGGGVCGDLAGFAAASYMRGIQAIQVPTSLLAMVDSSVGGKTAVDIDAGKNLVGAFLQPSLVMADVDCLTTLDPEQVKDACGEIIKHAVLADGKLLEGLTAHPVVKGELDLDRMARIVARNVQIKRDVVSQDEREKGARQTLNLGHTVGHAIEAASNYTLGHGACVAAGLCIMARASERMGWSSTVATARICECVEAHDLPTTSEIDADTLFSFAVHDKKRHGDELNIVVAYDIADVRVKKVPLDTFRDLVRLGLRP